ncbi:MAG: M48 family metalloprotease [Deltaproteobacteria bacterium]|nr:M48 family metalloprotease [Deltaproteobacteria bacterium]
MYTQLLYFITALLIFSIPQPGPRDPRPPHETLFLVAGAFLLFVLICWASFHSLRRASAEDIPRPAISLRFHRIQGTLSVLALCFLAIDVYVFHIKSCLQMLPWADRSITLTDLLGLGIFILHLCAVWLFSHPIYQRIHRSHITKLAYFKGHLSFSIAVLIPWLIISLVSDVVHAMKSETFLHTEAGQILLAYSLLICFVLLAPPLVVTVWGCESIEPGPLRSDLEAFCTRYGFRVADFKLWPLFGGEMLTAGIFGILPRLRYILITRGLLTILNTNELHAVMAHEMGHARRYHMIFYLLLFSAFMALTFSFNDGLFLIILTQTGAINWLLTPDHSHVTLLSLIYNLPFVLLLLIYFRFIFGFFMRNSERQADAFALELMGHPGGLVSSLRKIAYYSGRTDDVPSWHHFSIRQRISFLNDCYRNPALIKRHNRKLYGAAAVFFLAVSALFFVGSHLDETEFYRHLELEARIVLAEVELRRNPDNPLLLAEYGGLLFELGRVEQAGSVLEKALELSPDNPSILNNLAWLHATSPPPHFDPHKALELAVRAAELSPLPYVLDTLAEAYFVNSRYEDALKAIEDALRMESENRSEFLQRKQKIEDALRNRGAD